MERINREHVIYEMNKDNEPVLTVESGATVIFETQDCFSGDVQSEEDTVSDIDFSTVNRLLVHYMSRSKPETH